MRYLLGEKSNKNTFPVITSIFDLYQSLCLVFNELTRVNKVKKQKLTISENLAIR